jgi:hypothetical protein
VADSEARFSRRTPPTSKHSKERKHLKYSRGVPRAARSPIQNNPQRIAGQKSGQDAAGISGPEFIAQIPVETQAPITKPGWVVMMPIQAAFATRIGDPVAGAVAIVAALVAFFLIKK